MKKFKALVAVLSTLMVLALLMLQHFNEKQEGNIVAITPTEFGRVQTPETGKHPILNELKKHSKPQSAALNREDNATEYVSLARINQEKEYLLKVKKSNAIRQYLEAPRRDDPQFQEVLNTLLENGYGIEHWATTCSLILAWQMPIYLTEMDLKAQGYQGEDLNAKLAEILNDKADFKSTLVEAGPRSTGIDDKELIASLMEIPLRTTNNEAPFGYGGMTTLEGDKIFTDDDWMTETHKAYRSRSKPKTTDFSGTIQFYSGNS